MDFKVERIIEVPEEFIECLVDSALSCEIEDVKDEDIEEVLEDMYYEDIYEADTYYLMVVDEIIAEVAKRIRKRKGETK